MRHQWNGFVAIVTSELRARWAVFIALAALGLLAYLSPLLMDGLGGSSADEIREVTALIFSLLVTLGGALLLGGQMAVHPLAEGRLAFFLARPLSGWTYWWGQITAACCTLVMGWWLVWIPTILAGGAPWKLTDRGAAFDGAIQLPGTVPWSLPEPLSVIPVWTPALSGWLKPAGGWIGLWWVVAALLCLMIGHWFYMVLRLRTRWAVLDLLLLVAAAWGVLRYLIDVYRWMAFREHVFSIWGIILLFLSAALWAGGRQMSRGGVDTARSHGAFSVAFWPGIFVLLAVLLSVHQWMVSRGPEDLKTLENLHVSPDGEWLVVSGKTWRNGSYEGVYLFHPQRGTSHNLGPRFALPGVPVFSAQSNAVIWVQCPVNAEICELRWQELEGEQRHALMPIRKEYMLLYSTYRNRTLAVSEDGSRVAMAYRGRLEVYEFPSLRLIASQRLNQESIAHLTFEGPDALRVYHQIFNQANSYVDFWRLDLVDSSWTYLGASAGHFRALHWEADRLFLSRNLSHFVLLDRLGDKEWGRQTTGTYPMLSTRLLSTGQVVTIESESEELFRLNVYGLDGQQVFSQTFDEGVRPILGGEIEAGRLLVGQRLGRPLPTRPSGVEVWLPGLGAASDWTTQVFDASQGWLGDPWPGVLPAWQLGDTFEQSRWLLSSQGVQRLEDAAEGSFSTQLSVLQ